MSLWNNQYAFLFIKPLKMVRNIILKSKPKVQFSNVIKVMLDLFGYGGVSSVTIYLCPTGQSRRNLMLYHNLGISLEPLQRTADRSGRGRQGSYLPQYIKQLRKPRHACPSDESADTCYSVMLCCPAFSSSSSV